MSKKRNVVLLVVACLAAALIGAIFVLGPEETQAKVISDEQGPGVYSITIDRFKRHGPETIAVVNPFMLERFTQEIRYTVEQDGVMSDVIVSIFGADGTSLYRLESAGGQYTVTDMETGLQTTEPGAPIGGVQDPMAESGSTELAATLTAAGYTLGSTGTWRGREVEVYESVGPALGQLSKPTPEFIGLPVVYDLAPVSERVEMTLDSTTGNPLRMYRYAIDERGKETVIESMEIASRQRDADVP